MALTVDAVNVYYFGINIQTAQFAVMQLPIKGGSPTVLANGLHFPVGLTGDGGYVYWTDQGGTAGGPGLGSVNRVAKNVTMKAGFSANPATGYPPLPVQFTDGSTGAIDTWDWDFGDGSPHNTTDQNPGHNYSLAGNYKVTLKVTGPNGSSTKTATVKVKKWPLPKTAFTADHKTGPAPLTVQFTDASTGPPGSMTGWSWDFGDSGSSTEKNPSHTYTLPGKYKVTLTVTGPGGSKSKSTTIKVTAP